MPAQLPTSWATFVKLHFCKMQAQQKSKLNNPAYGGRAFALRHTFPEAPQGKTDNLMDYTPDKNALLKAQWDLIHNPENVQFAWTEEMDEGAMINIFSLIEDIRKANKKEEIILTVTQDKCPSGYFKNVKLGENKLSFLQINCTSAFENAMVDETITSTWREWKPKLGSKVVIKPIEKAQVFAESKKVGKVVYYQFHELKTEPAPTEELTDNLMFEFAVLEKEKHIFEEYLYPKYEHNVSVTWISQFNTVFEKCTGCWTKSCCRRACVYMLGFTNCANCTDSKIAKENPVKTTGRLVIAKFTSDDNWETEYNTKTLLKTDEFNNAISYIKNEIKYYKHPVVVGVHYSNRGKKPYGNSNKATYHFMVVVGYGEDENGLYLKLYDPGRTEDYKDKATNIKLYVTDSFVTGKYQGKDYTITEIIKYY